MPKGSAQSNKKDTGRRSTRNTGSAAKKGVGRGARRSAENGVNDSAAQREIIEALLQVDRARHDELGRVRPSGETAPIPAGPREQPAAPVALDDVDE